MAVFGGTWWPMRMVLATAKEREKWKKRENEWGTKRGEKGKELQERTMGL